MTRVSFIRDDRPLSRNLWWKRGGEGRRFPPPSVHDGGIGGDPREGDPTDGSQRKRRQHGVSARSPTHDGGNAVNDERPFRSVVEVKFSSFPHRSSFDSFLKVSNLTMAWRLESPVFVFKEIRTKEDTYLARYFSPKVTSYIRSEMRE